MIGFIEIIVYSCIVTSAGLPGYDAATNYGWQYAERHPQICDEEAEQIYTPITLEQCQSRSILMFMPGWLQRPENADRVWLGARCEER